MKVQALRSLVVCSALLSSCGGGGGGGGGGDDPAPKVILQVEENVEVDVHRGDALPVRIEGRWSAMDLGDNPLYIRVRDSQTGTLLTAATTPSSGDTFAVDTVTNSSLPAGSYPSTLELLACGDLACSRPYDTQAPALSIIVRVSAVPQWTTHQANPRHDGYVPIWVSNASFEKLWEWQRPASSEPIGGINAPVAGNGEVYVSTDVYFGEAAVIALDELTGTERWRVSFGQVPALNPPAIDKQTLYVATSGHEDTKLWGIDRADGGLLFQSPFSSQWGHYLAPTADEDVVYQTGGYYGGDTYAFATATGAAIWTQPSGSSWGMDSPAVGATQVYVHGGAALTIIDKASGEIESVIADPFGNTDYDYHGTPVIAANERVLAFSGGGFSGRASSNTEHYASRPISSFDVIAGEYDWSSDFAYKTFFATAGGVIYAGKNSPVALDAIDAATGEVIWSWVAPSTRDTAFHRNVVVTKNLLFVSTNAHVYAIDLGSRQAVWSYDEPGMIAISDGRILFVAPGARESDGRLIAFDLRTR